MQIHLYHARMTRGMASGYAARKQQLIRLPALTMTHSTSHFIGRVTAAEGGISLSEILRMAKLDTETILLAMPPGEVCMDCTP